MRVTFLPIVVCFLTLISASSFAQTRPANATEQSQEQSASLPPNGNSIEAVANQIDLLRKSLQTLNTRLREISDKLPTTDARPGDGANDKQKSIALNKIGRAHV